MLRSFRFRAFSFSGNRTRQGIVIGPILFVLAILGIIALALSSGFSGFSTTGQADRINAEVTGQINLIRSKIHECYMQSLTANEGSTTLALNTALTPGCEDDPYPCSDKTNGTLVSALTCPGDPAVSGALQSLWSGARVAVLPQPTKGFTQWFYMNDGNEGGRCIWASPGDSTATSWTAPSNADQKPGIVAGLKLVMAHFTSAEAAYNANSSTQKIVVYITRPTGTPNSHCAAP